MAKKIKVTHCIFCGKPLNSKKFCNTTCRSNWKYKTDKNYREHVKTRVKKYGEKKRKDPEFRKKHYKYWKEVWYPKNKDKVNEYYKKYRKENPEQIKKTFQKYIKKKKEINLPLVSLNYINKKGKEVKQ